MALGATGSARHSRGTPGARLSGNCGVNNNGVPQERARGDRNYGDTVLSRDADLSGLVSSSTCRR